MGNETSTNHLENIHSCNDSGSTVDDTNVAYTHSEIKPQLTKPTLNANSTSVTSSLSNLSTVDKRRANIRNVNENCISPTISERAARFWMDNISSLSIDEQLEIGCSIWYSMITTDEDLKRIMKMKDLEAVSLKHLDMIGWLVRASKNINKPSLQKLGEMHKKMGVNKSHFKQMLKSTHETFEFYFPEQYTAEVKYALSEIFCLSVDIMTDNEVENIHSTRVNNLEDLSFLQSLDACLESKVGCECLHKYLEQILCDDIATFLDLITKFRNEKTDVNRLKIAREIMKTCIDPNAVCAVDIAYKTRDELLYEMDLVEERYLVVQQCPVSMKLFVHVEQEMRELIIRKYWYGFVESMKGLQ